MSLIVAGLAGAAALCLLLAWILYFAWLKGGENLEQ